MAHIITPCRKPPRHHSVFTVLEQIDVPLIRPESSGPPSGFELDLSAAGRTGTFFIVPGLFNGDFLFAPAAVALLVLFPGIIVKDVILLNPLLFRSLSVFCRL